MKKIISIIVLCTISTLVYSQQTEVQVQLNAGLFSFSGKSAARTTFMSYDRKDQRGYTNSPYGARPGLSGGISGNIKRVTKRNLLFGVDVGYEVLRSKIKVDQVFERSITESNIYSVDGQTFLNNHFINVNPFMGYRATVADLPVDFTGGFDVGYCLSSKEKGRATAADGMIFEASRDRTGLKIDFRPRVQVATRYNKIGAYAGYSLGLLNRNSGIIGGSSEVFARYIRFGVTYQLK